MLYTFDDYTLDAQERTLKISDDTIALTPKVFETLLVLVQNRDHIMSKDELLNTIWPGHVVEESNITQNISVLRKALGETVSGKKYIATFPGRGYKFLEPVVVNDRAPAMLPKGSSTLSASLPDQKQEGFPVAMRIDPGRSRNSTLRRLLGYGAASGVLLLLGVLLIYFAHFRNHRTGNAGGINGVAFIRTGATHTLVRMEGAQYQPTWSRDGKQLAFVYSNPSESRSGIYVLAAGGLEPRRIVFGPGGYSSPVFSPDGKLLAYLHRLPNLTEILIYDFATSRTRRLTTLLPDHYGLSSRQMDWSPSGDFLVVGEKEAESDPLSLYRIYISNGRKIRLTYPDMDILGDTSPRFSPDGTEVAFIRMKYQFEFDVFVVPVTGGEARKLTSHSNELGDVDWDADRRIVYSADENGEFKLWELDWESHAPQAIPVPSIATDMPLQFSISRAAHQIAFSGYRPDLNIWSLDLTRKLPSPADWNPVIHTPGQDIVPSFSPDGKKIAFRSDVTGRLQIWVSGADGSHAAPIDTGSLLPSVIGWTPDSQSIVFCAASVPGIYEVSLSHKFPLRKISDVHMSHPFYSVDSKWIFVQEDSFIYRFPVSGGPGQMLTDQGGTPIMESKDGRYLYFGHGRMDTTISRLDLTTRQQQVVINSLIPGYRDAWTLAPHGIVFLTYNAGKPVIAFHDFATGKDREIADFPSALPLIAASGFSVSPDGRRLLVVRADPASANIQAAAFSRAQKPIAQLESAFRGQ
jgi:Tol biopolymer transport system component/DNA-binding winged helix-turn-helix (wHTH) protein